MEASAGGFYILQDYDYFYHGTEVFPRTTASKRVCFTLDETKPVHCSETSSPCTSEPLQLSTRLTRDPEVIARVEGWTDPITVQGTPGSASGISLYRLEVHGVDVGMTQLSVQASLLCAFV